MATIASTDITLTLQRARISRGSPGGERVNLYKLAFGNASLTYPTGGITIPSYTSFGMVREIQYLVMVDPSCATTAVWKYDYPNKKLRAFVAGAELTTADTFPAQVIYAEAKGW